MAPPNAQYFQNALSQIKEKPYVPPERRPSYAVTGPIERQVPSVEEPAYHPPSDSTFFTTTAPRNGNTGKVIPDTDFLKEHFFKEGRLTEQQALFIVNEASNVLRAEPNLLSVGGGVVVCGDIHGQYYDLMKLFEIGGSLEDNVYLFLGDYVDRGCFGIECLLYLYSLKIRYPTRIYMLRGNHECKHLTQYFTFQRECYRKYSTVVYDACISSFHTLPLAAILDDRFFCVHGGLSPELIKLSDLEKIDRFMEPPDFGLLCDLLWSDPIWNYGNEQEANEGGQAVAPGATFVHNHTRGCSYYFTYEAVCNFLDRNGLLGVIRGHEAQNTGYAMARKTPVKKFPSVITIFSAPNYCDVYHNRAAILKYANKNITIRQFNSTSHPYWLPNFVDAFTWSLPFVGAKIAEMLLAILSCCSAEELEESSSEDEAADEAVATRDAALARKQEIKNKILAVGRMQRVFQLLRDEAENSSELLAAVEREGGASPGTAGAGGFVSPRALGGEGSRDGTGVGAVSTGVRRGRDELGAQGNQIRRSIRNFEDARRVDIANERLPTPAHSPAHTPGASPSTSTFPVLQSPSTTPLLQRGQSSADIEMRFRTMLASEEEDEELNRLAERVAGGGRRFGSRPKGLKRFETA